MSYSWDRQTELDRFAEIWKNRPRTGMKHTKNTWDERADDWEKNAIERSGKGGRLRRRVSETVNYLRAQGMLNNEDTVIDIGCGPGRFVTAFAETAGHVTGLDLSPRMAEFGEKFAAEQGVGNVSFLARDFKTLDIDQEGWRGSFDLVFASITPALSDPAEVDKMTAMSRAYCFNSTYVYGYDPVEIEMMRDVFNTEPRHKWDGRSFYAMFNILWLQGYYPQVTYFEEKSEDRVPPSRGLAVHISEKNIPGITEEQLEKIQNYLQSRTESDGLLRFPINRVYGWILWDVRHKSPRNYD